MQKELEYNGSKSPLIFGGRASVMEHCCDLFWSSSAHTEVSICSHVGWSSIELFWRKMLHNVQKPQLCVGC